MKVSPALVKESKVFGRRELEIVINAGIFKSKQAPDGLVNMSRVDDSAS